MSLENIRIVLSRPLYGGNVGSACRAMMNMGISDLAVVQPTQALHRDAIRKMSLDAYPIYENRVDYETLADAVADCHVVACTTARMGLYRAHARTLREWAPDLLKAAASGKTAIVFGPEDDGLKNEEVALCTRIVQIPSTEAYTSINLAQAVMLCCYELYVASGEFAPVEEASPEASSRQRELMFHIWERTLLHVGFMKEDMAEHMMLGLRRILSRGKLTDRDVRILMGIAKQADWCASEVDRLRQGATRIDGLAK